MADIKVSRGRDLIEQVADLVAAYVSNNHVAVADLSSLIASVHVALSSLHRNNIGTISNDQTDEKATPSQIKKSIQRDGLISFLDGKTYKTLKRHLSSHGLDPHSYRAKFGLPSDYPIVAPSYSEARSNLARSFGLGRFREEKPQAVEAQPQVKERKKSARAKVLA